ncbi:MAG: 2-amino-4-hydroxy-6-hydroxymethyldihydropteridine diphosphokinase, partial [Planctomycetes bacterium]|nr:2-amino-4-hydroxy-6-hydroxymethyldihydropteridine diphosphokinase [Planctomycetota bacterium]
MTDSGMTVGETLVFVAFGSNEGDREQHLRTALQRLGATPGIVVVRTSQLRESTLQGDGPAQGAFLNGVV